MGLKYLIYFFCVCILCLSVSASSATSKSQVKSKDPVVREGECDIRVCFAIDSGDSITPELFALQKTFVDKTVRVISKSKGVEVGAVQYSTLGVAISPITNNVTEFLKLLEESKFIAGERTFTGGAIVYCDTALGRGESGQRTKLVLLGAGRPNFGGDPVHRADIFRRDGGKVFTIGVGREDRKTLQKIAGGESSKVFDIHVPGDIETVMPRFIPALCSTRAKHD